MKRPGEGQSTDEIFSEARRLLTHLQGLMTWRRNRDKAAMTLTDLFVLIEAIARRMNQVEFSGAPVNYDDEGADLENLGMEDMPMSELVAGAQVEGEAELAQEMGLDVRDVRLHYFRLFLDYHMSGCRGVEDVIRKFLAYARRFRPLLLENLGQSQAAVGRAMGKGRANIHAGEKRLVELLLKNNGTKGFHALGGQKSEEHRRKCREAQKGNTNRRDGEKRKNDEAA